MRRDSERESALFFYIGNYCLDLGDIFMSETNRLYRVNFDMDKYVNMN